MADEDNVLFMRGNDNANIGSSTDDVWDDSALIKAYDKAVNLAKEEVSKRMGFEVHSSHGKHKTQSRKQSQYPHKLCKKWTVGSPCQAVYSEDGEIYEAIILEIHGNSTTCIVKFVGYGNTEKVELSSLLESEGLESQIAQQKSALLEENIQAHPNPKKSTFPSNSKKVNGTAGEKMDCGAEESKLFKNMFSFGPSHSSVLGTIPPAPPLPPQLMARLPENDADALSSMLMSWYISGFHTGYYHGLKQANDNQEKGKK